MPSASLVPAFAETHLCRPLRGLWLGAHNAMHPLDVLLLPQHLLDCVEDFYNCRTEALASQHFLVKAKLAVGGVVPPLVEDFARLMKVDRSLLKDRDVALYLSNLVSKGRFRPQLFRGMTLMLIKSACQ